MGLSRGRILLTGQTDYPWEADGLKFISDTLPDVNPFQVWQLVDLPDPSTGRMHEIDCLVLGHNALYVVEMKGGPGIYEGDTTDWYRTPPGGTPRYMEPPLRLTNHKCKVLKSLLDRHNPDKDTRIPFVQALVFLTDPDITLKFRNYGEMGVVTRQTFLRAVQYHDFPGADSQYMRRVTLPQAKAVAAALKRMGVRPSEGGLRVSSYQLGSVIEQGEGYEDRNAEHVDTPALKRRARIYLVPQATSTERRKMLMRAAEREVNLLTEVREHPNVLRLNDFVVDAPLGPTVLFDQFDGEPLAAFIRRRQDLAFDKRIELIEKIASTLHQCHKKQVLHGALTPSAVLVKETEDGALEIRLYNFQLGMGPSVSATVHWSSLAENWWTAYQAPELRDNPASRGVITDLFSLGAVAYFILTGRHPGADGAEVDRRLEAEDGLDPRVVNDEIPKEVAEVVRLATDLRQINRADDVDAWLALLLDVVTAADAGEPEEIVDPLKAKKDEILDGDLLVIRVLGQGASSRVLEVERQGDERRLALKVALTPADGDRLATEAQLLGRLRHSQIVQLYDERVIADRRCLLIALAGDRTLRRWLRQDGPPSLDFAARFGEELLFALQELETKRVLHRDLKPDNLGVGTVQHKSNRLMLFDFSLGLDLDNNEHRNQAKSPEQTQVGTAGYRDPFLKRRGGWDAAADRWGAAITLHEMLTGVLPNWEPSGVPITAEEAHLVVAAERFDASVREQLSQFFARAFRREAEARFESAEQMRKAYNLAFEQLPTQAEPAPAAPSDIAAETGQPGSVWDGVDLAQITASAQAASLPLSNRALNALDRAGIVTAGQLLQLPENSLSVVRGVGTNVAKEILRFRADWVSATQAPPQAWQPFYPGYAGEDLSLASSPLSAETRRALEDAGLPSFGPIASAPSSQVEALLTKTGDKPKALRALLAEASAQANKSEQPSSIQGWLDALLPKQPKRRENLEMAFGLKAPLLGKLDATLAVAAKALKVTPANLSIALQKASKDWAQHPALPALSSLVHTIVNATSPALPAKDAAQRLLSQLGGASEDEPLALCQAAALIRIVCTVERDEPGGLRWIRVHDKPWLVADETVTGALRDLGSAADELARRVVIASPGEAARALRAVLEDSPLEQLTDETLTNLATQASHQAARSSRLEIYPQNLDPSRALALISSVLTSELKPDQVRKLVTQRYPAAEALPERPALDSLLLAHGLHYNTERGEYYRPGAPAVTALTVTGTQLPAPLSNKTTAQRAIDPDHVELDEFEEQITIAIERQSLRVIGVSRKFARPAALFLAQRFQLEVVALDRVFLDCLTRYLNQEEIDRSLVIQADQAGNSAEDWSNLMSVMRDVSALVLKELLPIKKPTLLVQSGILARYELGDFLLQLIEQATAPDSAALLLLVPGAVVGGTAQINGSLTIPQVGLPNTLHVPLQWITQRSAA